MCSYLFLYPAYHAPCDPAYPFFMDLAENKISRIASGMISRIIVTHLLGVNTLPKLEEKNDHMFKEVSYRKCKVFASPGRAWGETN